MAGASDARGAAYSAGACSCCAFILLAFASASPYMIWGSSHSPLPNNLYATYTASQGSFVAGIMTNPTPVYSHGYVWVSYVSTILYWSQLNSDNVCAVSARGDDPEDAFNIYYGWAQPLGVCGGENGEVYTQPASVAANQALAITAAVMAFFAAFAAFAASSTGSKGGYAAAATNLLAWIFTIAAFANFTQFEQVKMLRSSEGFTIPVWGRTGGNTGPMEVHASPRLSMYYGPGFGSMVTCFIMLTFSTVVLFGVSRRLKDDAEDRDEFGAAGASGEYGSGKGLV